MFIEIIGALEDYFVRIPDKFKETRDLFQKQIANKTRDARNA